MHKANKIRDRRSFFTDPYIGPLLPRPKRVSKRGKVVIGEIVKEAAMALVRFHRKQQQ